MAGEDGFPHTGIEDLGPGTRQGVQSGGDQPFQGVERGEAADAGDVRHFGRSEGVQAYLRIEALECREELLVEIDPQLRVQTALQQQLVAAEGEHPLDFLLVFVERGDESPLRLVGFAVEIAEAAARNADVGDVHVAVDLPGHDLRVGRYGTAHAVSRESQLLQGGLFVKPIRLLRREGITLQTFFVYLFRTVGAGSGGSLRLFPDHRFDPFLPPLRDVLPPLPGRDVLWRRTGIAACPFTSFSRESAAASCTSSKSS